MLYALGMQRAQSETCARSPSSAGYVDIAVWTGRWQIWKLYGRHLRLHQGSAGPC